MPSFARRFCAAGMQSSAIVECLRAVRRTARTFRTSTPNLKTDEQLIEGIKTVWASVWNFEAYEARERAGIDHTKVFMAVLIQEGINSESSGVMITTDPFNKTRKVPAIYISAKRGLGMRVVEGQKIAEQ